MTKIPRKYAGVVMGALISLTMSFIMSAIITLINIGLSPQFVHKWLVAFAGALPIGLPVAMTVTPVIKSIVERITK